ncbi:MAG: outer membrane protein assembly factor BamA [Candidatus Tectomicrobia bacterium]
MSRQPRGALCRYRQWIPHNPTDTRRLLLAALLLLLVPACATREARVRDADLAATFPEVKRITLQGHTHFSARALRRALGTKQRPRLRPWKRGDQYHPPNLEAGLRRLQKYYFDRGFLQTTARLADVQEDPEQHTVRLHIAIDEGPATVVTTVHLAGTFPAALPSVPEMLAALPLRPGTRITKAAFDASKSQLLVRLQDAGYARARIVPRTEVDTQQHQAIVTFTLQPGARTPFGHITITGTQEVKEQAVRRQVDIREGETYSVTKLTHTQQAIYDLGMFQAVTLRGTNLDEADAPLDIEIKVHERKRRIVQVGFGFSTVERFRLQVGWTHRNLLRGAERLTISGKVSSIEQVLELRFHLPYFLNRRTRLTQKLFIRNEEELNTDPLGISDALFNFEEAQPAFDLLSVGAESRLDHRFNARLSGAVGLELSLNEFSNVDPDALEETDEESAEDNILLVQFTEMLWNTSNSPLNPTRGLWLRGRLDLANTGLISDVSFVKLVLEARHYRPLWRKIILATRLKLGAIQPYGASEEIPFNVRFFAGGPGSIRGFAQNRVGPLDNEGDPLGGENLIEGSVELRFPIRGDLSGVLFVDFGNVFRSSLTYPLNDLRYAVGPGIRYNTLVGPVRFDIGVIVDRRREEDFGRLDLSIGQAF